MLSKFFLYYRDEDGILKNIGFQDYIFFRLENGHIRLVNPLIAMVVIEKIKKRELQLVGSGSYGRNIKLFRHFHERKEKGA